MIKVRSVKSAILLLLMPFLVQCAAKRTTDVACADNLAAICGEEAPQAEVKLPPMRYLAWLEGDYQTDYQPDRKVAEERIQKWQGKVPEPTDTDEYLQYISVLDASGKTGEAEKLLKTYLGKHPSEKRAVFLLGVHYMRLKKRELAQYFFATLEKDPQFVWKSLVYNNLAMLALQDKNRDVALEYFDKATKAQPPTAAPFVNLGALYVQSRSYVDAEPLFRRAIEIDNQFEDAALGLGSCLEAMGKPAEAHTVYTAFLGNNPDGVSVLFNDAILLGNKLKQREQAAEMMLRYIQRGGKETAKAHEIIQSWR